MYGNTVWREICAVWLLAKISPKFIAVRRSQSHAHTTLPHSHYTCQFFSVESAVMASEFSVEAMVRGYHIYHSLVKKGPWAVHITLCSDGGGWVDICNIAAFYHEKAPMFTSSQPTTGYCTQHTRPVQP